MSHRPNKRNIFDSQRNGNRKKKPTYPPIFKPNSGKKIESDGENGYKK